jgi:hypothetical protein
LATYCDGKKKQNNSVSADLEKPNNKRGERAAGKSNIRDIFDREKYFRLKGMRRFVVD